MISGLSFGGVFFIPNTLLAWTQGEVEDYNSVVIKTVSGKYRKWTS